MATGGIFAHKKGKNHQLPLATAGISAKYAVPRGVQEHQF